MAQVKKETSSLEEAESPKDIWYFGYGPIVNEMVRKRRGINTTEVKAAYVPDYRLTFAFGGTANIVNKVGFEVHGLLMKLKSQEDWDKLREFESGNEPTTRTVVPYDADSQSEEEESEDDSHDADTDFFLLPVKGAIKAFLIEKPDGVDDAILDGPIERLPQERYLKLIAQGMRQHRVSEEYITDHIEACPFNPNRKPEQYFSFPVAKKVKKITWSRYERLCARARVEGDLYFVLGNSVFRCGQYDPVNPLAKWFETHGHGQPDCTYFLHLTIVDPSIPLIYDAKDVTPQHVAWAENHCVEVMEQYGMGSSTRVYEIVDNEKEADDPGDSSGELSIQGNRRPCWKLIFCPFRALRDRFTNSP